MTESELRAAVLAGSLPSDARVRKAASDGRPEVLDERDWSPLHELLDVAPPVREPAIALPAPGVPGVRMAQALDDLRARSAYARARSVIAFLAMAASVGVAVVFLFTLLAVGRTGHIELGLLAFVQAPLALAAIYVARHALLMLADIADCQLRQETERLARSFKRSARD